jgi:hypothetical protein
VVVDHDRGRLVWAAPGACEATLDQFFDLLGEARCAKVELVSADAAEWIAAVVARRCPAAVRCADPFHVVKWATDALDQVRREVWNAARKGGDAAGARELKGARFALWKNPQDLTRRQRGKLARIAEVNQRLYRAYLLKEELRLVFKVNGPRAVALLDAWLSWARRCRIPLSSPWPARSPSTATRSWSACCMAPPTHGWNRSTLGCACSPESRSGSAPPTPSSAWPCLASADSAPHYPADDPRMQHKSLKKGGQ